MIGGTSVRWSSRSSFANGQPSRPEPSTTPTQPAISSALEARSKSLPASEVKISAGASTLTLIRLTQVMSGRLRRA
jgi:hypothetical protein